MEKIKRSIFIESDSLKLIRHPKKDIVATAAEIGANKSYSNLFPKDSRKDIIYISACSFTIANINRNDCLILPDEGISMYKTAISTALNVEHEGDNIVGFCVNSYLSNIKNNKILSEEEAQDILVSKGLVNVGVILGCWKINHPELAELLVENFDENSENFDKVKLSFECYFSDFSFFVSNGKANYPDGDIISNDVPEAEEMFSCLKMNGGNGLYKGNRISICPINSYIGGNALTFTPANQYSDLTGKKEEDEIVINVEASNQNEVKSVIINTEDLNMSKIVETTEEKKEIVAEAMIEVTVDKDMGDAMKTQLDIKIKELGAKDAELEGLKNSLTALQKDFESSKEQYQKATEMAQKLQEQLDKEVSARKEIEAKEIERTKKEILASRLSQINEFVDVNDSNKDILEKECADASDEDFAKKLDLYKGISKKIVASTEKAENTEVKQTVETIVSDTAKEQKSVNIIATAPSESILEKFKQAFNNTKDLGYNLK